MKISRVSIAFLLLFSAVEISSLTQWDQMGPPVHHQTSLALKIESKSILVDESNRGEENSAYKPCFSLVEISGSALSPEQSPKTIERKSSVELTMNTTDIIKNKRYQI